MNFRLRGRSISKKIKKWISIGHKSEREFQQYKYIRTNIQKVATCDGEEDKEYTYIFMFLYDIALVDHGVSINAKEEYFCKYVVFDGNGKDLILEESEDDERYPYVFKDMLIDAK